MCQSRTSIRLDVGDTAGSAPGRGAVPPAGRWLPLVTLTACLVASAAAGGCGMAAGNIGLGLVGGTLLAGQAPGNEIEQVYYLGVFDPRDQVPPTVYRLTVRGQASGISNMKFGSGWVQAALVDSLNTHVGFDGNRPRVTTGAGGESQASIQTGRRLVLFGPEGFREAPKDHRLVIVMGANPEAFFRAIDQSLAHVTQVQREQANSEVVNDLFLALGRIQAEQRALAQLSTDVASDLPAPKEPAKAGQ